MKVWPSISCSISCPHQLCTAPGTPPIWYATHSNASKPVQVAKRVQHLLPASQICVFISMLSGQQCSTLPYLLDTTPCAAPRDALPARPECA